MITEKNGGDEKYKRDWEIFYIIIPFHISCVSEFFVFEIRIFVVEL